MRGSLGICIEDIVNKMILGREVLCMVALDDSIERTVYWRTSRTDLYS